MPIVGMTDQQAAFPRIGILRKGGKKPDRGIGKDLTYFRFTSDDEDALAAFADVYGDKPTDINVVLPFQTTEQNFESWQEHWVAGGLKHRCDGETCVTWQDNKGEYHDEPTPCPGNCKPVGRLSVIIPELKRLAFVTVLTTSVHDIITLTQNLKALELARGDLRGIPMILRRRPRMVSTPSGNGKRARREKWLLTLEAAPQFVSLQLAAQQAAAMPELIAPADDNGVIIDTVTGEIIDTDPGPEWVDVVVEAGEEPEAEPPPDCLLVEIPAGKHEGKTLGWLLDNDRDYIEKVRDMSASQDMQKAATAAITWKDAQPEQAGLGF